MTIVIVGGTGYLGGALVRSLRSKGHKVWVLTREPRLPDHIGWPRDGSPANWSTVIQDAAVVINLAGEPLIGRRWTTERKAAILDSRVTGTRAIAAVIARAARPPVLISGSAVGIYGTRDEAPATEDSAPGSDFLARVVTEWEGAAAEAARVTRVVFLRTGIALSRHGGALPPLALPFHFFVGGRVGSGRQHVSWIHRDDWVSMVEWAAVTAAVSGPLNATAPQPVTNADLATALGAALRRPARIPAPAFAVRLALGEMADAAILSGQRVLPAKAQALGFTFRYPTIDAALGAIYGRRR